MSTSSLGLNTSTLRTTLPFLTGALHTTSILSGLYFLLNPSEGAKLFGTPFKSADNPTASELAFTRIHGVRDLALGAVGLRLINYAYGLEVKGETGAARAVGYAVGSLLFAGSAFAVADGWICSDFAGQGGLSEADKEGAEGLSFRHVVLGVPVALLGAAWLYI